MFAIIALAVLAQAQDGSVFIPTWTGLAAKYEYKQLAWNEVTVVSNEPVGAGVRTTFTFAGTPGDTVHAEYVRPSGVTSAPVVLLLHGLGGSGKDIGQQFGKALIANGIGYADIDAPGHGARATAEDQKAMQGIAVAFMANKGDLLKAMMANDPNHLITPFLNRAVTDGVKDNRRLLDYLMSRKDVDYHHVGVIGVSMGSIMGAILGGVDPRVKAMLLMVGGDPTFPLISTVPTDLQGNAIATSCSLYAPHFKGPVRMLNGSKDTIMPRSATERLYAAFPSGSATIGWYDSDHFLPPLANEEAVQWITDHMK